MWPARPRSNGQRYALRIDGGLLRQQRLLLLALADSASKGTLNIPEAHATDLLEGVVSLLDEIADQAHDRYGIDCLLDADETARPAATLRHRRQHNHFS